MSNGLTKPVIIVFETLSSVIKHSYNFKHTHLSNKYNQLLSDAIKTNKKQFNTSKAIVGQIFRITCEEH